MIPKDKHYWEEVLDEYYDESLDNWEWPQPEGNSAPPPEGRGELGNEQDTPHIPAH